MSETKLKKYLIKARKTFKPPTGRLKRKPVILTDSRGFTLQDAINHPFDQNITWWCKSSVKIEDSFKWLKRKLPTKLYELGDITLYIWLGTCNLTTKDSTSKYLSLTSSNNESVDHIIKHFHLIKDYVSEFENVKLVFLELPVYSIKKYNTDKKHKDPQTFKESDKKLETQVQSVNAEIRNLNRELDTISPDLSLFLQARKQQRVRSHHRTVFYYNYELYTDGVHPGLNLSRAWLRDISERIKKDCWE